MPKCLFYCHYVQGLAGLLKEAGPKRQAALESLFQSLGGTLEAHYYGFGDTGLYIIAECPDNVGRVVEALRAAASGTITVRATVLLTPEEVDAAATESSGSHAADE